MLEAHDQGMTSGEYVFYTFDVLPDTDVLDASNVWAGGDGRDVAAQKAFESVFHVSEFNFLSQGSGHGPPLLFEQFVHMEYSF